MQWSVIEKWSAADEERHQRMLNQFAYLYMKECEDKSVEELNADDVFHRKCFEKYSDEFVLGDKHLYLTLIARGLSRVRTGLLSLEELKDTEEVRAACTWAKRHDGEFYKLWKA